MAEETSARQSHDCLSSLLRTEALITGELSRHLRARGVAPAAFRVMAAIETSGGSLCPHEIGERLSITRGAVSQLLDTLEEHDLVRRTAHAEDRRMLVVELTERARSLLMEILPDYRRAEQAVLSPLDPAERRQLFRLLAKIQTGIEARSAAPLR